MAATGRWRGCRDYDHPLLLLIRADRPPGLVADACDHPAVAFARDGDALYLANADGVIERASLAGLSREAVERGP